MLGIKTAIVNFWLNRAKREESEIHKLRRRVKELEKLKFVEKPGRNLFKMIAMITAHSLNRFFAAHMQTLETWMGSSLKNMRLSAHDEVSTFFKNRPNVLNWCNCSTLHDIINLVFMFLADDNAYRVIFDRILTRWQKDKLIIKEACK